MRQTRNYADTASILPMVLKKPTPTMEPFFLSITITIPLSGFTRPMTWRRDIARPLAALQMAQSLRLRVESTNPHPLAR
jgi:hypothetical protein